MIRFFDTLRGEVVPFEPLVPGEVRLYTCGPTVYNYNHIGNYRAYVFEDLLKRFLVFMGYKVVHVMNITDVDDKIIRDAGAKGVPIADFVKVYTDAFFEGLAALRIAPADRYPRATEHIPDMVRIIQGLLAKGYAYRKDGSIYFSIAKFPGYGKLSKIKRDELKTTSRIGARIEADEYEKESAQDFALWKAPKPGEPSWDTALGPGRPGWHIECSAMSSKYLGETFDIHCGGVDNIFPHHENEIAQSEAFSGKPFVRNWLHCHHLIVDGEKMAKSKGNQYTLADLAARGISPVALRFLLLGTHYRKVLNFTFEAVDQAKAAVQRIQDFAYELDHRAFPEGAAGPDVSRLVAESDRKFRQGLSDDLNIAAGLTAAFELVREANALIARNAVGKADAEVLKAALRSFDRVLAVLPEAKDETLPADLAALIDERERVRSARDFKRADEIRDVLLSRGIVLEDTRDGVRWKRVRQ
ncbi:MAG: cysteine--tRNA ligase [Candidatus Aminicenantes bacterium]|nr:cysteine--tRNA ligase [Candidatus Aminicenantes bacterium]